MAVPVKNQSGNTSIIRKKADLCAGKGRFFASGRFNLNGQAFLGGSK
jgi:hypothetical protein